MPIQNQIEGGSYGGVKKTNTKKTGVVGTVSAPKTAKVPSQSIVGKAYKPPTSTSKKSSNPTSSSSKGYGGGGGGGNGHSSSASGRGTPTPAAVAPAPPPPVPSIQDYLAGDAAYKSQQDAINKALADYTAQYGTQLENYKIGHQGRLTDLNTARERGAEDLENDFAARGLLKSGLYADELGKFNTDFDRQASDLAAALAEYTSNLATGKQNFTTEQQLALQRAEQEAIARRAAQYGL